ncbi:MAG: hypothetical protein ACTHU0_38940 [Kofleriaceae bacterium]
MTRGAAVLVAVAAAAPAHADVPLDRPAAVDVDRDDTAPGRTELGFDSGAPIEGWGATLSGGWLERPIRFELAEGGATHPVRRRQTLGLGGAVVLGTAVVLDARLAMSHQTGDRLRPLAARPLDRYVLHDLRLGARVRVVGTPTRAVFVRGDFTLPTGDDRDFAGDASWSLAWHLIGRATLPHQIVLAGSAGIRFRGDEVTVGDRLVGDELDFHAGAVVPVVADQLALTAELAAVVGNDVGIGKGPSPVEARVGAVVRPSHAWTLGARVGRGLSDEIGAPAWRGMIELTYQGATTFVTTVHEAAE